MNVTDPRGRYDDHVVTHSREVLGPKPFEKAADSEAATIGWVVLAFVFDDEDRVLLVDEPWADGWTAPGGVLQSGESLAEAVVREVREETGVEASPIRSHAINEFNFANERIDETSGWTAVFFGADADTTEIEAELGLEGERIDDAAWFEALPNDVFDREFTEEVYQRCLSNRPSR